MINHAKRLRRTRANMLGTDDEEHYWDCHKAAKHIEELESGKCRFNCRTEKEAFMAGFDAGAEDTVDSGKTLDTELYSEVTRKAWRAYKCGE